MKKTTFLKLSLLILAIIVFTLTSCTDEVGAKKTLDRNNYKPIAVGGYGFFAGSDGDIYKTNFKAVAPNGDTVTGCVTKGVFKGSTIRLDD
jgi:hypothetical protein